MTQSLFSLPIEQVSVPLTTCTLQMTPTDSCQESARRFFILSDSGQVHNLMSLLINIWWQRPNVELGALPEDICNVTVYEIVLLLTERHEGSRHVMPRYIALALARNLNSLSNAYIKIAVAKVSTKVSSVELQTSIADASSIKPASNQATGIVGNLQLSPFLGTFKSCTSSKTFKFHFQLDLSVLVTFYIHTDLSHYLSSSFRPSHHLSSSFLHLISTVG